MSTNKRRVLIIGYGACGSQTAAALAKKKQYSVTVLTPFDYMEVSVTMTKSIAAGPEEHKNSVFPLLREDGVEYIIDNCVSLTSNEARTKSGQVIPFDLCLVAVGHRIPNFMPNPDTENTADLRKQAISTLYSDLLRANSIVIAGGGAIGTEAAADIKLRHKDKKVTVVHSQAEVLSAMRDPFRLKATAFLEKIGIELVMSDRVVETRGGEAILSSGKKVPCDLYLSAFPTGGNATFLPEAARDKRNYAIVDDTFRVQGFNNVFAAGDCSNFYIDKTYVKIADVLPTLLANIDAYFNKQALKQHQKAAGFMGQVEGPMMVAFGHELPDGYGVGPNLPGCMGGCCWFCCCCQTPAGHQTAKIKSDFNKSIVPKKGKGLSS